MKEAGKTILKTLGIYHPLQAFYRRMLRNISRLRYGLQYRKYRGPGYTCNFCQASYTRFASWFPEPANRAAIDHHHVIAGYGAHIICPRCLSTARERLLKALLETRFNIEHKTILHLSPERPVYEFIRKKAGVTAADYAPGFYRHITPLVEWADATRLAYANHSFDLVIANHIMEHIPNDALAMRELYRVLKPGGAAILQVPFSTSIPATLEEPGIRHPARQSELFGQSDHVRIYQLDDYMQRLRRAGFTVTYIPYEALTAFYGYAIQEGEGFIDIRKPGPGNGPAPV